MPFWLCIYQYLLCVLLNTISIKTADNSLNHDINLLSNGAAPKDVQELPGHADVSTTMNICYLPHRRSKVCFAPAFLYPQSQPPAPLRFLSPKVLRLFGGPCENQADRRLFIFTQRAHLRTTFGSQGGKSAVLPGADRAQAAWKAAALRRGKPCLQRLRREEHLRRHIYFRQAVKGGAFEVKSRLFE